MAGDALIDIAGYYSVWDEVDDFGPRASIGHATWGVDPAQAPFTRFGIGAFNWQVGLAEGLRLADCPILWLRRTREAKLSDRNSRNK